MQSGNYTMGPIYNTSADHNLHKIHEAKKEARFQTINALLACLDVSD